MKTFIRLFSLLFALIITFSAVVSCNDNSGKKEYDDSTRVKRSKRTTTTVTTTSSNTTATPFGTQDKTHISKLPEMDWDEDVFYILGMAYKANESSQYCNFEIWREKMDGSVLGDAVWARNESLKKKYNFIVEQELVSDSYNEIQILYDTQDDVYDLVIYRPDKALAHASSGYLLNLYDLNHIKTDHIAWNTSVNNDFFFNNALYFTSNYFLLQDKAMTSALFFNNELPTRIAKESGATLPDIAKLTLDGKWTLEVFNGYVKTATTSASDSKNNIQRIGIACDSTESFASFFYGSGAALSKNVNGKVQLVSPSFATTHRIDIIGETLFDSTLVKYPEAPKKTMSDVFAACDTIFYASHVHKLVSQDLGIMKDSFLLLPFPKYDVNQESYHNLVSPTASSVFAIPYTAADPDQISFYLQAISEESVNTTYTAYIDSMVKHSHEEVEKKLAYLVLSSQKFDIAASLNPSGVYTMISKQIPEFKTNIYERLYNTKKQNIETALNEYLSKFENH